MLVKSTYPRSRRNLNVMSYISHFYQKSYNNGKFGTANHRYQSWNVGGVCVCEREKENGRGREPDESDVCVHGLVYPN